MRETDSVALPILSFKYCNSWSFIGTFSDSVYTNVLLLGCVSLFNNRIAVLFLLLLCGVNN